MASGRDVTPDYVNKVIEAMLKKGSLVTFDPKKTHLDFKEGDVVKCTYMQGLFRIFYIAHDNSLVLLNLTDKQTPLEFVKAGFLEKVQVNPATLKVLFDGKS